MSADNFIGVGKRDDGTYYIDHHGNMSQLIENESQYIEEARETSTLIYPTRAAALEAAHDLAKQEPILEYGVFEL